MEYDDTEIPFFFRMNPDIVYIVLMAGCASTVGEMNAMLTVVFLNEIVSGVAVLSWFGYRLPLVVINGNSNAQRYRDDILAHHVISLFHNNANISIFQDDNVTSYTASDTVHFLITNNIYFIDDWPAKSPDINPIEHAWDILDRRVRRRLNQPANFNELRQALIQEWNNIPQAEINNLVNYMRRRYNAVVNSRGGHTRY